jgi:hypothetical protein
MNLRLELRQIEGRYALAQLPPGSHAPSWVRGRFAAMVFSNHGITVACEESAVPAGVNTQSGFRCLEIVGVFELSSVGVVAAAVRPLAEAGISLFVHSTWETDFILVQDADLPLAIRALIEAGHKLNGNEAGAPDDPQHAAGLKIHTPQK